MADESEPERGVPLPLRLGETFYQDPPTFYNIAFDFKPGKIDLEQAGSINIDGASVNVGFQTNNENPDDFVYYQGAKSDTGGKDAIIVYDPETQEYTLQLVHTHVRLKQIRDTTEMVFPDVSNKTSLQDLATMEAEGYNNEPRERLTSTGSGLFSDDEGQYKDSSPGGNEVQVHDIEDMDGTGESRQDTYADPASVEAMDVDNKGGVDPELETQEQNSYMDEEMHDAVVHNVDDNVDANTSFKDRRRSSEGLDVSSSSGSSSGSDSDGEQMSRKASMASVKSANSVKSVNSVTSFREMADAQQPQDNDGAGSAENSAAEAPESSAAAITHQDSVASNTASTADSQEIGRRRSSTGLNVNLNDLDDGLDLSESDSD